MKNIDVEKMNRIREERGFAIREVAEQSGVPMSSCAKIFAGLNDNPTLDTLKKLAKTLNCIVDDFLVQENENEYYSDKQTAKLAQELHDNPNYRMLFDATKDLSPDDLRAVIDIANRIKGTNNG